MNTKDEDRSGYSTYILLLITSRVATTTIFLISKPRPTNKKNHKPRPTYHQPQQHPTVSSAP